KDADTLLVGWGGTYGHLISAAEELCTEGTPVAMAQFRYVNPLPANTHEVFSRYKCVIVAELNTGQFADFIQAKMTDVKIERINKIQGQPFLTSEVKEAVKNIISK
ncbi:MAG: 2-oxoacid:acceptor oxidoreductase subunit alpha, partial [Muribaculaceae bacterium]|nr:2-oxoacid:acceptor oxidoreductase subunit alpha [Muribaculaceae bacterium]